MDMEYGDDDIGSLEDEEVVTRGSGYEQSDAHVQAALADFLKNYRKGNRVVRHVVRLWRLWRTRACPADVTATFTHKSKSIDSWLWHCINRLA
jgi:hypothetical protein